MDLGLQGRKAIVTGAAMGIGRATAEALAQEGCTVAALDIDETALKELTGTIIAVMRASLGFTMNIKTNAPTKVITATKRSSGP